MIVAARQRKIVNSRPANRERIGAKAVEWKAQFVHS